MNPINYLPILVASLVAFAISSIWYSPLLFGKEWIALQKISEADMKALKEKGIWKSYLAQFIMTVITFSVLAFIVSMAGTRSSSDGAFIGLLAWIGFIIPTSLGSWLWKKESFTLIMIDVVNNLIILAIGGAIIGAWK